MRSRFLYLVTGIAMLVSLIQCNKAPTSTSNSNLDELPKPELVTPTQNTKSEGNVVEVSWEQIKDANQYALQISESSDFSSFHIDSTVAGTSYTASSLKLETTYYWKVKAVKTVGKNGRDKVVGPWSDVWQFTTGSQETEVGTVELVSPEDGNTISTTEPKFDWDTVSTDAKYHYQLSQNAEFTELVSDTVVTSSAVKISKLNTNDHYYWRVEPVVESAEVEWSEVYDFTIDIVPSPVTLLAPSDGATGLDTTQTLQWEEISAVSEYQVQLSTSSDFSSPVVDKAVAANSYQVSELNNNQQYYWRVQSKGDNDPENWSNVRDFTTKESGTESIPAVTLTAPSDGATDLKTTQTLQWKALSGVSDYQVQLSTNNDFSNSDIDQMVSATSYEVSRLENDQQYYWRVRAGGSNPGNWSNVRSFTTKLGSVGTVTLVSPTNNATGLNTTQTLQWEALSGVKSYKVQLSISSDFSSPVVDQSVSDLSYDVSGLNNNQQYYWRVQAEGDESSANWSKVRDFTTKDNTTTLSAPVQVSPTNGSSDVSLKPTFEWEQVNGAVHYILHVSFDGQMAVEREVNGTTFTPSEDFAFSTTHYWRIRAVQDGSKGSWSGINEFTTTSQTSGSNTVSLTSPSDGARNQSTSLTVQWESVSGVSSYQVQVSTSSDFFSPVVDQSVSNNSFDISGLNNDQQYYWRVQTEGDGNTNNWSSTWDFRTETSGSTTDPSGSVSGDRQALIDLYEATGGSSWHNSSGWGNGNPSDSWYGVEVNAEGRVVRLDLFKNNLTGRLPSSIGNLTDLQYLNVKNNYMGGDIPASIGDLVSLEWLVMAGNPELHGKVYKQPPEDLATGSYHPGKTEKATNDFTGPIPSTIGELKNLEIFELAGTSITHLPDAIGNCTALRGLYLSWNTNLDQKIPSTIGNLKNLQQLQMLNDGLYGTIPPELGNLTNLISLNIGSESDRNSGGKGTNQLTGSLPDFSNLTKLQSILLDRNNLDGEWPHYWNNGNFRQLVTLRASWNNLTGTLHGFENLPMLRSFSLTGNQLSGSISSLNSIDDGVIIIGLGWNNFTGEMPQSGWPDFHQLRLVYLNDNSLTGHIPGSFFEAADNGDLRWLYLQNNNFTSMDPYSMLFFSSPILETVDISGNSLVYDEHIKPALKRMSQIDFKYGKQTPPAKNMRNSSKNGQR